MAGNFWQSSHFQEWILDRQDLLRERHADLSVLSEDEYSKIMIFFANFIQAIGENWIKRQQVLATATVFFKRFYARNSLKCVDPFLMAPTSLFLAAKVEEYGVISNPKLINACQGLIKSKYLFAFPGAEYPYKTHHILECEFFLMEMMDCCLVVYHPYRPLMQYIHDMGADQELLGCAWRVVNDSLRTDIPLKYPPYLTALAALHIAAVITNKGNKTWFADLNVDMDKIQEIVRQILSLYDLWKKYDEKNELQPILAKMPKPNTKK